jgi:very-short-patch-repair endonuclease
VHYGITDAMIRAQVDAHRWQRVHPSTFVAHNGELGFRTRAWAAVLFCGPSAVVSHRAAGYLIGLLDRPPAVIDVSVPARRRPRGARGIRINRRRIALASSGSPPRVTVEDTVLDLVCRAANTDEVVSLITAACQRRLTTAARLREAAQRRGTLPWRSLVNDVLLEADSAHSALEWRYLRDVERRHGLPASKRQAPGRRGRSNLWRDVAYRKYRLIVELDGTAAHPPEDRHRDMARDNRVVVEGGKSLSYGWHAVAGHFCEAADQVATVLQHSGWTGTPTPCGPNCPVGGRSRLPRR